MATIPVRQLKNHVSEVMQRVEAGESLVVTVSGRAVARLEPLATRPSTMPSSVFFAALTKVQADPGLADDLANLLADTTDDVA